MSDRTDDGPGRNSSWQEPCANKRQKKRVLQGAEQRGARRDREKSRRKRLVEHDSVPGAMQSLTVCFEDFPDPRIDRRRRHLLIDIIVIAVCATIANADGWKDMEAWADSHEEWLQTFLALPNGIPSRDTLRRTIMRLDPGQFEKYFLRWLRSLRKNLGGVVAIDGKTLRRSKDGDKAPLHIVSAWATEQHLTLGQRRVDGKSNEITAIPELLELLELQGATVTIDAMGCQKHIAAQIIDKRGHYCLAVKDNQETLAEDLREAFALAMETDFAHVAQQELQTSDKGHGRKERRYYCVMPAPKTLRTKAQWKGLKSIGMTITYLSEDADGEVRYYITSCDADVEQFATAVRNHWGIENSLHWVMDVTFREDESRIRKGYGAENVSWLRRLAISIIKHHTYRKDTIRGKRVRAAYNLDYLIEILAALPTDN